MICKPCQNTEHKTCDDKVDPETGKTRQRMYRSCDCQHVVNGVKVDEPTADPTDC